MRSFKMLLLLVGVVASAMLASPTSVLAGTASCSTTDFDVSVSVVNSGGRTTYTYNLTRADKNPNKAFFYLKLDLDDPTTGDFKFHCASGSFGAPNCSGGYKANGDGLTGGPISKVWDDNRHNDGLQITSIAVATFPITIDVIEREPGREGEDETTILLPVGNKLQTCGPIAGPMQAQKQDFEGSPLVLSIVEQTFANGCTYRITSNPVTNVITSMVAIPPLIGFPPDLDDCTDINPADDCSAETGLVFCPPGRVGQPPLQSLPGGTCYYGNIKFRC